MAIPKKDSLLVPWSTNFNTRINASPTTFGLTEDQATAYAAVHTPFITAYNTMMNARADGTRSSSQTQAKDTAKANLLALARELYALVQANTSVSDANKVLLGVHVRDTTPTPVPAPSQSPEIDIVKVSGRTVTVRLHGDEMRRGKPSGVQGASVYAFAGSAPPETTEQWVSRGITTRPTVELDFGASETGSTVWITACWYNAKAQTGPAADPVSINLPAGGMLPSAVMLKVAA